MKRAIVRTILIITAAILFGCVLYGLIMFVREYSTPMTFSESVSRYCFMYGVDANLVYAVIKAESGFDEFAESKKGAKGLMQLMPATEKFIAERLEAEEYDPFDPDTNIRFGVWYLKYLSDKFEATEYVLIAYNAGEGNLRLWMEKYSDEEGRLKYIPYPETKAYVKNVLRYYELYRNKYNY